MTEFALCSAVSFDQSGAVLIDEAGLVSLDLLAYVLDLSSSLHLFYNCYHYIVKSQ